MTNDNKIREIIRKLIQQEIEEASSTASVGGSYNTPHAFDKKVDKDKDSAKQGAHKDPAVGDYTLVEKSEEEEKDDSKEPETIKSYKQVYNEDTLYKTKTGHLHKKISDKWYKLDYTKGKSSWKKIKTPSNIFYKGVKQGTQLKWVPITESITEGKYHQYRNDESKTPKQKIGNSIKEVKHTLIELERMVGMTIRLKTELNMDSRGYWKRTQKDLVKINERLTKLSNKIGKMY